MRDFNAEAGARLRRYTEARYAHSQRKRGCLRQAGVRSLYIEAFILKRQLPSQSQHPDSNSQNP